MATIIKTQLAQIRVEVTVEVIDRPIFIRRITTDRDWDQLVTLSNSSLDAYSRSFVLDTRGVNVVNHKDPKIDALWDQIKAAQTPEEFSRLSKEVQRYIIGNMVQMNASTLPFIQAARERVKGYVFERGYKFRFETTWLDR